MSAPSGTKPSGYPQLLLTMTDDLLLFDDTDQLLPRFLSRAVAAHDAKAVADTVSLWLLKARDAVRARGQ